MGADPTAPVEQSEPGRDKVQFEICIIYFLVSDETCLPKIARRARECDQAKKPEGRQERVRHKTCA